MRSIISELASLLYTVNEVAALCECSRALIYQHMREGILPWEYVAGRRLMHEEDIERYRLLLQAREERLVVERSPIKKGGKRAK